MTLDPIISKYKFTNTYRASDRVSQYLIREVIYTGSQSPSEVFFRILLFKLFNRIETWELLKRECSEIDLKGYKFERYDHILSRAFGEGKRLYSGAYIMPAATRFGTGRKHSTHLRLLEYMLSEGIVEKILRAKTLKSVFDALRSMPMLGDFLAFQYVIDLNYSDMINFPEAEFVVPGPGAKSGLRKCFHSLGGMSEEDAIRLIADRQEAEFERRGLHFRNLWGRRLQLIDCQNLLCEVDKYARVAHPDFEGIGGRARIKQHFVSNPNRIRYWYPPKWGINHLIPQEPDCSPPDGPQPV